MWYSKPRSKPPQTPFRQKEKYRAAAEAHQREIERAEATLAILKEQANKADEARKSEEDHKHVERDTWLKQLALEELQLNTAKKLNCITAIAAIFALAAAGGIIASVIDARMATVEANRAWIEAEGADVSGDIDGDKDLTIRIYYSNLGKGPALEISRNFSGGTVFNVSKNITDPIDPGANSTCNNLSVDPEGPVRFPNDSRQMWFTTILPRKTISAWSKPMTPPCSCKDA
jgi:hypothetical protein